MNKKVILCILGIAVILVITAVMFLPKNEKEKEESKKIEATVLSSDGGMLVIQDNDNVIYTFINNFTDIKAGDYIVLEYSGILDKSKNVQDSEILNYEVKTVFDEKNIVPKDYNDNGIFSTYYLLAYNKLSELNLDEKIGQILLVRYPDNNAVEDLKKYNFGGFVFFEKDFRNKTKDQVVSMINNLQSNSKIPLLTAVDEEGGSVVRVSSNPNLASSPFKSPKDLYDDGKFSLIRTDTINKSSLLKSLGLNLNLAPVVDVTTSPDDYMYKRALGENTTLTSEFAKTVIEASKGSGVSYTLKHFPGYGNNKDTHVGSSTDPRTLQDIKTNDLPPFEAGIKAGAEAILVSHNIVTNIDPDNPASLSTEIHNMLRNDLKFTGIIITDDISMGALNSIENTTVKAILAGNDLIITTDYEKSVNEIKSAINKGTLSENQINKLAFRVLAWKYYKGLMIENSK